LFLRFCCQDFSDTEAPFALEALFFLLPTLATIPGCMRYDNLGVLSVRRSGRIHSSLFTMRDKSLNHRRIKAKGRNGKQAKAAVRDVVVIGASAGGTSALIELVRSLPPDFPAAVFVVLHIPPYATSRLPEILSRSGPLPAVHPRDGDPIETGKIYVAPPDHHLLMDKDKISVKKGPKENRFRPSVDALFRSAAYNFGSRVIGVVLSGVLDDGTSGLWSIKRMGGLTVIQDPEDTLFPNMPVNVLEYVEVDHISPVAAMAALFSRLIEESVHVKPKLSARDEKLMEMEIVIATQDNAFEMGIMEMGILTPFTCPECHGVLVRLEEEKIIRFRCHTGHAYTIRALLSEVTESVEQRLWQAMRGLEETNLLLNKMGDHLKESSQPELAQLFFNKAKKVARQAKVVHENVFKYDNLSGDFPFGEEGGI
jgi:two-component system chemotaxis response regulator CheB